tara:strand:+ start:1664 stop:2161 length:498 start_codon:yes stop_codon:yes gene_type:complete
MKSNDILLVDTCAIIEACRTGCWNAISKNFRVETVDECIVEAQTGKAQRIYPPIPEQELRAAFHKVYTVSEIDRATFELGKPEGVPELDPGERDLWVHAWQRPDAWYLCGPDKASMKTGFILGHRERLISLESTLSCIGINKDIKQHYSARWLEEVLYNLNQGLL